MDDAQDQRAPGPKSHRSKVGIGMPVYNGEKYLEASIRANLAQTFTDLVLYIADNASTDRTGDICRDYAARDSRVVYIRNPRNLGAAANYRRCFEPADCQYFRWSNADDLLDPTLVEKCVRVLDANADTVLVYGKSRIIDADGGLMHLYDDGLHLPQESPAERFIAAISAIGLNNFMYGLIRRDALARTRLLGSFQGADINLVLELTLYGKFHELPEHLFSRRMHPEASSWDRADLERQRNFWDPAKRKLVMQTWRRMLEYNRAALRAPIALGEKASVLCFLVKRAYWQRGAMVAELADLIRHSFTRRA